MGGGGEGGSGGGNGEGLPGDGGGGDEGGSGFNEKSPVVGSDWRDDEESVQSQLALLYVLIEARNSLGLPDVVPVYTQK